jgi:SpoVK/Ycf46/Vps4 family AAA+-type ATPase
VIAVKATLIIKLIEAHCNGSEDAFKKAVNELAYDEENKGNIALSSSVKEAYTSNKKQNTTLKTSPLSEMTFSTQSTILTPKDKDSTIELVEILQPKVTLSDVALPEKTKEVLLQIIQEQKKSKNLLSKGITPTNRLLFCGPPGCGKTLTANAIAGELEIPIAYVKLDGLVSSYLGQTGTNIRKIFDFVKNKNIMLFLDEFDAIAKKRDDTNDLGELKRIVTTLLQNMDAMPANVFLIAATNHHHLLDPAIWRRFDTSILFEAPNPQQRKQIIEKFLQQSLADYTLDVNNLVNLTESMSGSQICSFLRAIAKQCIMNVTNNTLDIEYIADIWLKHTTFFINEDSDEFTKSLFKLNQNGVSVRTLEKITGIPKSTLTYKFNKKAKTNEQ